MSYFKVADEVWLLAMLASKKPIEVSDYENF